MAARGDKRAELELAERLEAGDGMPMDLPRAVRLYRSARAYSSGTLFVYVPGVGGKPGYTMPVVTGAGQRGEPEASFRLGLLYWEGRGVPMDHKRARRLIEEAARGGYAPAVARLGQASSAPALPRER